MQPKRRARRELVSSPPPAPRFDAPRGGRDVDLTTTTNLTTTRKASPLDAPPWSVSSPAAPPSASQTPYPSTAEPRDFRDRAASGRSASASAASSRGATPRGSGAFDRGDLPPIRTNSGLSFAEALARNSGGSDHSGSGSDLAACANAKRKAADDETAAADARRPRADADADARDPSRHHLESPPFAPRLDDATFATTTTTTEVQGAFSPLQQGPPSALPFTTDPNTGVPCVDVDVVVRALTAAAAGALRAHVVDVRYPPEYARGRLRGAVNVFDPLELQAFLCALVREDAERAAEALRRGGDHGGGYDGDATASTANSVFILYDDHGDVRAPRMWRHLRNLDRRDHLADYPALTFPHTYVMRGGHDAFARRAMEPTRDGDEARRFVVGAHARADDASVVEETRWIAGRQRGAWLLARHARGIGHAPTAAEVGEMEGGLVGGGGGGGGGGGERGRGGSFVARECRFSDDGDDMDTE